MRCSMVNPFQLSKAIFSFQILGTCLLLLYEAGDLFLGFRVCQMINSPNLIHTVSLQQAGRITELALGNVYQTEK